MTAVHPKTKSVSHRSDEPRAMSCPSMVEREVSAAHGQRLGLLPVGLNPETKPVNSDKLVYRRRERQPARSRFFFHESERPIWTWPLRKRHSLPARTRSPGTRPREQIDEQAAGEVPRRTGLTSRWGHFRNGFWAKNTNGLVVILAAGTACVMVPLLEVAMGPVQCGGMEEEVVVQIVRVQRAQPAFRALHFQRIPQATDGRFVFENISLRAALGQRLNWWKAIDLARPTRDDSSPKTIVCLHQGPRTRHEMRSLHVMSGHLRLGQFDPCQRRLCM